MAVATTAALTPLGTTATDPIRRKAVFLCPETSMKILLIVALVAAAGGSEPLRKPSLLQRLIGGMTRLDVGIDGECPV